MGQPTQLQSYIHVNGEKLLAKTGGIEEEGAALCLLGNVSACRGRKLKKNAQRPAMGEVAGPGRPSVPGLEEWANKDDIMFGKCCRLHD